MDKMFITKQTGERLEVGVVRFFEYNETAFLIYTLSEVDANNYVKLYVTKINVENVQSITITEESEWNLFKDVMKGIIKNNKSNLPLEVTDLDPKLVNNIIIYDSKVFKLNNEMVNFLQMNKKVIDSVPEVDNSASDAVQDIFNVQQPIDSPVQEVVSASIINNPVSTIESNVNEVNEPISGVIIPELPSDMVFKGMGVSEQPKEIVQQGNEISPVIPGVNSNIENPITVSETTSISEVPPVVSQPAINSEALQESLIVPNAEELQNISYQKSENDVNELMKRISDLENEINSLKNKLDQIKNIIG